MHKTENEQKKEFLLSYKKAKVAVARMEEQLEELRLSKQGPAAINYGGMPHGTDISDLSDYAVKLDEIEQGLIEARYERICAFQRIQNRIEAIENEQERAVLKYRYLGLMGWNKIATKMQRSYRQTLRIHGKALLHFNRTDV